MHVQNGRVNVSQPWSGLYIIRIFSKQGFDH